MMQSLVNNQRGETCIKQKVRVPVAEKKKKEEESDSSAGSSDTEIRV